MFYLPDDADKDSLLPSNELSSYMTAHYDRWCSFALSRGHGDDVLSQLIMIRATIKTSDCSLATWTNTTPHSNLLHVHQRTTRPSVDNPSVARNRTIFISYLRMKSTFMGRRVVEVPNPSPRTWRRWPMGPTHPPLAGPSQQCTYLSVSFLTTILKTIHRTFRAADSRAVYGAVPILHRFLLFLG